eukprot:gene22074-25023_t
MSSTGQASPVTIVRIDVVVQVEEGDGLVEFEDLNFDDVQGSGGACVAQASHSCVFEGNPKGDIVVRELSHVTMINCVLHGPKLCVDVEEGGSFTAIHCTFHSTIHAWDKVPLLELVNCTVVGCKEQGIQIGNGTTARLQGCRIMRCKREGLVGKGLRRLHAHMEDCVVTECSIGFLFDMGKMDVTLRNTQAVNNAYHGVFLTTALTGSIVAEQCTFKDNHGSMDVVRMCGHDCSVIINGVAPPLRADLEFLRLIREDFKRMSTEERTRSPPPSDIL